WLSELRPPAVQPGPREFRVIPRPCASRDVVIPADQHCAGEPAPAFSPDNTAECPPRVDHKRNRFLIWTSVVAGAPFSASVSPLLHRSAQSRPFKALDPRPPLAVSPRAFLSPRRLSLRRPDRTERRQPPDLGPAPGDHRHDDDRPDAAADNGYDRPEH